MASTRTHTAIDLPDDDITIGIAMDKTTPIRRVQIAITVAILRVYRHFIDGTQITMLSDECSLLERPGVGSRDSRNRQERADMPGHLLLSNHVGRTPLRG